MESGIYTRLKLSVAAKARYVAGKAGKHFRPQATKKEHVADEIEAG